MSNMMSPVTRRLFLHRGARLSLALTFLLGSMQAADVHAGKKKKKQKVPSVAERTEAQRLICAINGGQLVVLDGPDGGNTTECKGGSDDGTTCINTKKKTTCWYARTDLGTKPGGGGAVPPSGGNEDPTGPSSPVTDPAAPPPVGNEQPGGGAAQPGGGGAEDPSGGVEQPSGSGSSGGDGVVLTSYSGGKHRRRHRKERRR